jgi:repressor of nif and glnA expression
LQYGVEMIGAEAQDVKRKAIAILKILEGSKEPLGARVIARQLKAHGIELGERAVRYHLKLMDERGLTRVVSRDGRLITDPGVEELRSALVGDKVGFAISRIENLAFRTDFDLKKHTGSVPVNISFFPKETFSEALRAMMPAFEKGLCVSNLVATAHEGERFGETIVPKGKAALDSHFGGILEVKNNKPLRFVELIHYAGSSLDPSEVFIRARMTSVAEVVSKGAGKMLANYREIPAICRPIVEDVVKKLKQTGINGFLMIGNASEPVCEVPIELNRIGVILIGGLNPVAAAEELGIEAESHAMSTVMEYKSLIKINDLL